MLRPLALSGVPLDQEQLRLLPLFKVFPLLKAHRPSFRHTNLRDLRYPSRLANRIRSDRAALDRLRRPLLRRRWQLRDSQDGPMA
jgi:hypothetical protein